VRIRQSHANKRTGETVELVKNLLVDIKYPGRLNLLLGDIKYSGGQQTLVDIKYPGQLHLLVVLHHG